MHGEEGKSRQERKRQVWKLPYAMSHMVNCKSVNVSIGHLNGGFIRTQNKTNIIEDH